MSLAGAGLRWRVIVDEHPRAGPSNMALDHAMAEHLPTGEGVLRLYGWSPPTVSFGRNEPALGLYDREAAEREGVAFVRRPTGGRAVLHDREVTYCAVFPAGAYGGLRESYLRINEGLVEGLRGLGCPAEVTREGRSLPPDAGPCFQAPAPGEVVLFGRKLVGSAQVLVGGAVLQHGSVILGGDQRVLSRVSGGAADQAPSATLESFVGPTPWRRVADALAAGLGLALGGAWSQGVISSAEHTEAERLANERYATDAWTWRR